MTHYMKAVVSNCLVEVTQQSLFPPTGRTSSGGRKPLSTSNIDSYEANLKVSISRAKKRIRRLLECNFTDYYAFLTLTFKYSEEGDISDLKHCNKLFAVFKKRLAYYLKKNKLPNFKYIGVTEFQDENRSGAVHYHIVSNLTKVPAEILQELWEYGWVNKILTTSDVTENEKIVHYLNKEINDQRLNGYKRYFHSHGLMQPINIEVKNSVEFYQHLDKCQPTLKHGETYHSPYTGDTKYEQYYVKNAKELIDYVQEL